MVFDKINNWFDYVINTWNKGTHYNAIISELVIEQQKVKDLNDSITNLKKQIAEEQNSIKALKEQLKELLNVGVLDLVALKDWYEAKYGDAIWLYNYDGEGTKDVKNALLVQEETPLTELSKKLVAKYGLGSTSKPQDIIYSLMSYFSLKSSWKYMTDEELYNKTELWQFADKSCTMRKGDCDDLAILMHNLIYYLFKELGLENHYWRLKLAAGGLIGSEGGHCFNIWLHDDGEWYVIESTYDLIGSQKKTWLKTPVKNNNLYGTWWGFARRDRSWLGKASSLEPYKKKEQ